MYLNGVLAYRAVPFLALVVALAGLAGCGRTPDTAKAEMPVPIVSVSPPVERVVTQYEFATGRTESLEQVEIRARVNGYLQAVTFEPGKEVAKGKVLFEIDPEPYKAELAKAKANQETAEAEKSSAEADVSRAETRLVTTKKEYERQEASFKSGAGSLTDRDKAKGDFDEAGATVRSDNAKVKLAKAKIDEAKAAVRTAQLNLGYCTIAAPIAGVVGDRLVTEGNLVSSSTLLTTVVAVEKMDVGFDVDENTLERIQQAVRDGKIVMPEPGTVPAEAGLSIHGSAYPLKGKIYFSDNHVDTKTGTIRMKARFDNPKPETGSRIMSAGMYTRIRVPIGAPTKALLVPESAFGSDQGIKYLFLIGPENKAIRMDAKIGIAEGDMRVVESVMAEDGKPRPLTLEDKVIVSGLQRVRPGLVVDPKPATK